MTRGNEWFQRRSIQVVIELAFVVECVGGEQGLEMIGQETCFSRNGCLGRSSLYDTARLSAVVPRGQSPMGYQRVEYTPMRR